MVIQVIGVKIAVYSTIMHDKCCYFDYTDYIDCTSKIPATCGLCIANCNACKCQGY
jgi:hypothetical protein